MSGEAVPNYALRISIHAVRDRDEIEVRIADLEGDAAALKWRFAFAALFTSLATNPRRYAIPHDADGFTGEVRAVTFSSDAGTAPYRLIYKVIEDSPERRQVQLLHIRHAAARPMTRKAAREIEAQSRE